MTLRSSEVLAILEKMGYTVNKHEAVESIVNTKAQSDLVLNRIARVRMWDNELLEHTQMRIETMSERALLNRADKITHKDKMMYFAKSLYDSKRYPAVLRKCCEKILDMGW